MDDQYDNYFRFRGVTTDDAVGARIAPWLADALPPSKDAAILDVGCGFGRMLSALRRGGYSQIEGIDLEDAAIQHCQNEGLNVVKASILDYKPERRRYDAVIMSHVLEHLPKKETISVLRSIGSNLLSSNGSLFVMVPNAQSNTGAYWMYEDWTHETLFTAGSLLYVLRRAGFADVTFADPQGLAGVTGLRRLAKRFLLLLYNARVDFWNRVTSSAFHAPSPRIYSFELKAIAQRFSSPVATSPP